MISRSQGPPFTWSSCSGALIGLKREIAKFIEGMPNQWPLIKWTLQIQKLYMLNIVGWGGLAEVGSSREGLLASYTTGGLGDVVVGNGLSALLECFPSRMGAKH